MAVIVMTMLNFWYRIPILKKIYSSFWLFFSTCSHSPRQCLQLWDPHLGNFSCL